MKVRGRRGAAGEARPAASGKRRAATALTEVLTSISPRHRQHRTMEIVNHAREQLGPLTRQLLDAIDTESHPMEASFFAGLNVRLQHMNDEGDLAELFFELSSTAFRGFAFSDHQAALIDRLLRAAEEIAFALSAPDDNAH